MKNCFMNIYDIPFVGNKLLGRTVKKEGGTQISKTIRTITNKRYKVDVGMFTYGGCFAPTFNYGNGGTIKIGRYCSFSSNIHYFAANHPMNLFSMSPYFFRKEWGFNVLDVERAHLEIGNDVWVGYGVLITSGCRYIGNGAVIAAGSVLTKDVPSYSVVGGVPGKIIKSRFDDETIKLLEKSQWWELQPDKLIEFHKQTTDPRRVAELIIEYKER